MGDTGSLALGGVLGVIAICVHQELALIIAGGVFVLEAGSVLIQVASFKLTGKRIFAHVAAASPFRTQGLERNDRHGPVLDHGPGRPRSWRWRTLKLR